LSFSAVARPSRTAAMTVLVVPRSIPTTAIKYLSTVKEPEP
jgi:hypothetical protein